MSEQAPIIVVTAIVPAAGRSGRMGTAKPLLEVGGRPMVLGVVDALLAGGVDRVTVVTTRELRSQLAEQLPPRVSLAVNDDPSSEMIHSVRIGMDAAQGLQPAGHLVCPADAAGLSAADVRRCVDAFAETPDRIVVATHGGRRGHPMIFPASLAAAVRSAECDDGLNRLARNHPQFVREVRCDSPGTLANVNTPADYAELT